MSTVVPTDYHRSSMLHNTMCRCSAVYMKCVQSYAGHQPLHVTSKPLSAVVTRQDSSGPRSRIGIVLVLTLSQNGECCVVVFSPSSITRSCCFVLDRSQHRDMVCTVAPATFVWNVLINIERYMYEYVVYLSRGLWRCIVWYVSDPSQITQHLT
jgi:hypothetical protein